RRRHTRFSRDWSSDVCSSDLGGGIQALLKAEQKSVVKLAGTPTARNLTRVFFLMERLKGLGGKDPHGISRVHVVGAGVMGGDIESGRAACRDRMVGAAMSGGV